MLRLSADLSAWQITAGEAFLFEAQLVDANSVPLDISDEALVLSLYDPGSRIAFETAIGARRFDAGEYFRWAWPGTFTEQLLGRSLRVELARRYNEGKIVLADGQLTVATSAAGVPSLAGVPLGEVVTRATFRAGATPGAAMTRTISLRAWDEGPVAPPAYAIRNGDVVALML